MKIYARLKVTDDELTLEGFTPHGNIQFTNEVRVPITDPYIQPLLEDNKDNLVDYLSDFYQVTNGTQALAKVGDAITEVPLGENYLTYEEALELILERYKATDETSWYVKGYDPAEGHNDLGVVIKDGSVWGIGRGETNGMTYKSYPNVTRKDVTTDGWRILVPEKCDGESWKTRFDSSSSLSNHCYPVSSPEVRGLMAKLEMTVTELLEAQGGRV